MSTFFDALKNRRSYYGISKESTISDEKIQEIVEEAVKYTPTAFNSQTSRAVVLLGEQHDKLWNHTEEILREVVGNEEAFQSTAEKMASFRNGYGSVLFLKTTMSLHSFNRTLRHMQITSRSGQTNPTVCFNS